MNLYRVTCRGMAHASPGSSMAWGVGYVVAKDAESAYRAVREKLDADGIGFTAERALDKIELLAQDTDYAGAGYRLYIA